MGLVVGLLGTVAAAAPAQPDDTLTAAAELAGFIPQDVRYGCSIDPNPTPVNVQAAAGSIRVGLRCPAADGVNFVEYYLFATNTAMKSVYTQVMGPHASEPVRSVAANCPSDGTWNFAGQEAGQSGCFYSTGALDKATGAVTTGPEYVIDIWTYDAENILGVASTAPGNTNAVPLQTWWDSNAGPTKTATDVPGVVTSYSGAARAQRVLLSHVPAVTRKGCTPEDVFDPVNGSFEFPYRLWIRAAVSCSTSGGADTVVYESISPAAAEPYFANVIRTTSQQASSTQPNPKCPDTGAYTARVGKQRRTVGQYVCVSDVQDSNFNNGIVYAEYVWSYPKLGVIAYAFDKSNDPDALIKWFDGPKSGPE